MSENLSTNVELDSTANGTVSFATDVVATIAGLAATEVEGVAAMIGGGNMGLVDMLRKNQGNRPLMRGVKVEISGNKVTVQLTVTVDYGSPVPNVAREIQDNVKKAIETMTGLEVSEINIYVQGISFEKENQAAAELEQKQRAALAAQKVEQLNKGEDKPEADAKQDDGAEGEHKRLFRSPFTLRRQPDEDKPDASAAGQAAQNSDDQADAPKPEAEKPVGEKPDDEKPDDEKPTAEQPEESAADAQAEQANPDEAEIDDMCDGHCEDCTLECDAARKDAAEAETVAAETAPNSQDAPEDGAGAAPDGDKPAAE